MVLYGKDFPLVHADISLWTEPKLHFHVEDNENKYLEIFAAQEHYNMRHTTKLYSILKKLNTDVPRHEEVQRVF